MLKAVEAVTSRGSRSAGVGVALAVLMMSSWGIACASAAPKTATPPAAPAASPTPAPTPRMPPLDVCVEPSDGARQVAFSGPKGETVYGASVGSGDVGVVMAHQYFGSLCEWWPEARRLRDQGYRVVAFDFGHDLVDNVIGAAAELRREGSTKIVLAGASMGATASLVAATSIQPTVAGVASLSGPAVYHQLSAADAVKTLTVPVLFMDARDSKDFPADARAMHAACPSAHKELLLLPGTDHGAMLLGYDVGDQARAALEGFIARAASG